MPALSSALTRRAVAVLAAAALTLGIAQAPAVAAPTQVVVTVIGAQNYGGSAAFAATTSVSGLTVTGVTCTKLASGAAIAPTLPVGTYTIGGATCSGGVLSNPNYTISGYTGSTFSDYRVPLTVRPADAQRAYNTANPAFTYAFSGFVNGEDASVVTGAPTLSTSATATSAVGGYAITAVLGTLRSPNYYFAFAPGTLTVTPALLTVTVAGAQNYGAAPAFAGTTSVSGVTASGITCTAVTSGASVAPALAVGTYTVDGSTCSGAVLSSGNYAVGSYTGSSFTVYRAALTVRVDDQQRTYGAANPALTYTITGFANGDDASVVTGAPTLSTSATASSGAGSYPISGTVGSLRSPDYYFLVAPGTLSVTPAPVSVTVTGAQFYGGAAAFSGTTGVSGLSVSGVSCTAVSTGAAVAPSLPVGSYTLDGSTCSGGTLSSGNYTIAGYTGGAYADYRAALTVTAADQQRAYGAANPALTYSITGFVNGDDVSVVTGAPALATTARATSDVGAYPITGTVGTLRSPNYYFVIVPGTLTVSPAPATLTVSGAQVYGSSPAFAASTNVSGLTASGVACTTVNGGTSIAATLPVGTYTIDGSSCSGGTLSSSNYVIAGYTGAPFAAYRAALTVTPDDQQRTYRTTNPTLTYSITGFLNGDDASIVTGAPVLATSAKTASDIGTYPITATVGTLRSPNYYFVFASGTLTVTPAPVTVKVLGAQNYGDSPAFAASTTVSGLTVTGAGCTALTNGTAVAPTVPAGTYTVDGTTCSGGVLSSTNYTIAGYTGGSFSVYRVPLTVNVTSAQRVYGVANPAFGSTLTGFVNGEDATVVTGAPVLSTTATASSPVGTYPITATAGTLRSPNYYFVLGSATLTVNPAPVTVKVLGAQNYGSGPAFAGSTTVSGLTVTGASCSALTGGTAIAPTVTAGTYTIDGTSCSGAVLSSSNYTVAGYTGGSFSVYRVPLTVNVTSAQRAYGAADPAFGWTFSGFVNGDDASVVTGAPALSTTATASSAVGTYPITGTVGSLRSANYYYVINPGTLTITKAQLTVTSNDATREFGAANPTFTYSISGFQGGDTASVVSGSPALSTTADASSHPGSYPISAAPGTLAAANYTFAFGSGTLTVVRATPTLTTTSKLNTSVSGTLTYGTAKTPVVGATITFTVNNVGAAVICTAVTDATGKAQCAIPLGKVTAVVLNGYVATYAGSADVAPVSTIEP